MKRQPTKGRAHTAGYLVVVTLITLAIAEAAARLITEPGGASGKLGIVALVPLRPDANFIRQSLDGWYSHDHLLMHDRDIGWTVRPNKTDEGDHTNAQGIRTSPDRVYSVDPPE